MRAWFSALVLAAAAPFANGQALFTGETGSRGASSLLVAANASSVRDFTAPANFWTAYTRGLHHRVDGFAFYGNLSVFGRTQRYAGLASNLGLLKRAGTGWMSRS